MNYCLGQDLTGIIRDVFNTSLTMPTFLENFAKADEEVIAFWLSTKVAKSCAPM